MKREIDLVREILLAMSLRQTDDEPLALLPEWTSQQISYHLNLLNDADLIEAIDVSTHEEYCWIPVRLTWLGCEWLDNIRSEEIWGQIKTINGDLGGASMETLIAMTRAILLGRAETYVQKTRTSEAKK